MLDPKDIEAIRAVMKEENAESEKRVESMIDLKLTKSENLILERTRNILENQINKVQKNLDELNQYYRITKLENDNTALLLKMQDQ